MKPKSREELAIQRAQMKLIEAGNAKATLAQRSAAEVAAGLNLVIAVPVEGVKAVAGTVSDIADAVKANALGCIGAWADAYLAGKAGAYAAMLPALAKEIGAGNEDAAAALFAEAVGSGKLAGLVNELKTAFPQVPPVAPPTPAAAAG